MMLYKHCTIANVRGSFAVLALALLASHAVLNAQAQEARVTFWKGSPFTSMTNSATVDQLVQPASISEIKQALRLAAKKNITVAVVGGGHSIDAYGINPGGMTLDLSKHFGKVSYNATTGTATVGGGARLGNLYKLLASLPEPRIFPGGANADVGVGLLLVGGTGAATHGLGMASDQIVAAQLVLANGTVINVDAASNPDILWALRGGTAVVSLGVVTSLEVKTYPQRDASGGSVVVGDVMRDGVINTGAAVRAMLKAMRGWAAAAAADKEGVKIPDIQCFAISNASCTSRCATLDPYAANVSNEATACLANAPPVRQLVECVVTASRGGASAARSTQLQLMAPLMRAPGVEVLSDTLAKQTYVGLLLQTMNSTCGDRVPRFAQAYWSNGGYTSVDQLTNSALETLAKVIPLSASSVIEPSNSFLIQVQGGKTASGPSITGQRNLLLTWNSFINWRLPYSTPSMLERARRTLTLMAPTTKSGQYGNEQTSLDPKYPTNAAGLVGGPANLARLCRLQKALDPGALFRSKPATNAGKVCAAALASPLK